MVTVPAVILAGGRASRMGGGDKTLLPLGGAPILSHVLRRLGASHERLALSANGDPVRFAAFGLPVLADMVSVGPLAGILAGLRWAAAGGADLLLTVPGDSPFLPPTIASALAPAPAMAASGGRRHPTVALWRTQDAGALAAHLDALDPEHKRGFSVVGFADAIGMRVVTFETDEFDPFFNVNTPDDLARAEAMLGC
jgi:molybdopterin-guanine dinucleotide biosynthesis protein A